MRFASVWFTMTWAQDRYPRLLNKLKCENILSSRSGADRINQLLYDYPIEVYMDEDIHEPSDKPLLVAVRLS